MITCDKDKFDLFISSVYILYCKHYILLTVFGIKLQDRLWCLMPRIIKVHLVIISACTPDSRCIARTCQRKD